MTTGASHSTEQAKPLSFLRTAELSLPKNDTASKEVQNLSVYKQWVALHDQELKSLNALVEISKEKSRIDKEFPNDAAPEAKDVRRELTNQERTATINLNQARGGIESIANAVLQRNPFDTGLSSFGNPLESLSATEIFSNLDLRILIREDLNGRERDKLKIVHDAINKYDTDDKELLNATNILNDYSLRVAPKLTSYDKLDQAFTNAQISLASGKTTEAVSIAREATLHLTKSASSSHDEYLQIFLAACSNPNVLSDSLGIRLPADSQVLSNEYLQYATKHAFNDELEESSSYYRSLRDMWDTKVPWSHENKLELEADMTVAHCLYSTLKRFHYLGEAYQIKLDEIESTSGNNKENERKNASRTLWQLFRQTEFLLGTELEDRLVMEIQSKAYSQEDLQKLGMLAALSQAANQEEFTKYKNFLATGERDGNVAHLPSSHRVGTGVLQALEKNGISLGEENKELLNSLSKDPRMLHEHLSKFKEANPTIAKFHSRMTEECEPYGAILSLINLVPENGANSPLIKANNFTTNDKAREDTLNLLYGVSLRIGQLSERLNCGSEQIGGLLQDFLQKNKGASNYQALQEYVEDFKSRLTSRQNNF